VEEAGDLPLNRKLADASFGSVVVPRDTIFVQESEEAFSVADESLLVGADQFIGILLLVDPLAVEPLHLPLMLVEVSSLEAVPLHVCHQRDEQFPEGTDERLEGCVVWVLPKVLIHVADEMNQAFLLTAVARIIAGIEI
jgi:hypothetical protein